MPNAELPDINVLLYAFFDDSAQHQASRDWLNGALASEDDLLLPDFVLAGFVRIATNRRAYPNPGSNDAAFRFADQLRESRMTRLIAPGPSHWRRFESLCRSLSITGADQSDAYLAAFALEHDGTLVTADRGFRRFTGLRIRLIERTAQTM